MSGQDHKVTGNGFFLCLFLFFGQKEVEIELYPDIKYHIWGIWKSRKWTWNRKWKTEMETLAQ